MKIRKATKEDIKRIDEIYVGSSIPECRLQFPEMSLKEMKKEWNKYKSFRIKRYFKEMKLKKHYWIVMEEEREIVGFGNAFIENKNNGRIELIYVDQKYLRKKIGLRLLKNLEKWLKEKKVKFIWAGIYYKNTPSFEFFNKRGFKPNRIKMRKKVNK